MVEKPRRLEAAGRNLQPSDHDRYRTTQDVDIVAADDERNLAALADAPGELRARRKGVDADLLGINIFNPRELRDGANFGLATEAGGLDVWTDTAELRGSAPWEELRERAIDVDVAGVQIPIVSLDDLIALKRAAGRPKDLDDVAALTSPLGPRRPQREPRPGRDDDS